MHKINVLIHLAGPCCWKISPATTGTAFINGEATSLLGEKGLFAVAFVE